jgi:hypothetical protein
MLMCSTKWPSVLNLDLFWKQVFSYNFVCNNFKINSVSLGEFSQQVAARVQQVFLIKYFPNEQLEFWEQDHISSFPS